MHPRYSRALRRFTHAYLHTQTTVHTNLMNHGYSNRGKPQIPQLELGIKMAKVLGSLAISVSDAQISAYIQTSGHNFNPE